MKKSLLILSLAGLMMASCKNESADATLTTTEDSLSYAIGISIGKDISANFAEGGLDTVIVVNKLIAAFKASLDTADVELAMDEEDAKAFLDQYFKKIQDATYKESRAKDENILAENAKRPGVVTTASGLQYEILKEGKGAKPTPESMVKVHYHGTFSDGKVFDSSVERGQPAEFPVNRVIPAWTEALLLMPVGSKWKIWAPYQIAYGDQGYPPKIPPYTMLTFEIELIDIIKQK